MLPFLRRPDIRVLIVCTANVCRSPMAAALLETKLAASDLRGRVAVRSRGTAVAAPGAPADPRVRSLLAEVGVKMGRGSARQVKVEDLAWADLILVMEPQHRAVLEGLASAVAVECLADYLGPNAPAEIADPYFGSRAAIRDCQEQLDRALAVVAGRLRGRLASTRSG